MYKVMLVDDEPFVRMGMKSLIQWEDLGFKICFECDNGEDALEQVEKHKPDLVITDIKMPEMDGLEFVKKCNEKLEHEIKFIFVTGYSNFDYARFAIKQKVANYLLKPVDEEELIAVLNSVREELDSKNSNALKESSSREAVKEMLQLYLNGNIEQAKLEAIKESIQEFDSGKFSYIIVKKIKVAKLEGQEVEFKKVLLSLLGESIQRYIFTEKQGYGIICSEKLLAKNKDMKTFTEKILKLAKEKFGLDLVIYIGKSVKGISKINQSRDSCLKSVHTNLIIQGKNIFSYEESKEIDFNDNFETKKLYGELLEWLERGNAENINQVIENIFKAMEPKAIATDIIKSKVLDFQLEVVTLINSLNGDMKDFGDKIEKLQLKYTYIYELSEGLLCFSIVASDYLKEIKKNNKSGFLYEVKSYIDNNYNKDIRLKNIAEHFFVNPIYLGKIFNKFFNSTFNDYLNNYRLEKAKELLKTDNYKINEISELVGYKDSNYFVNKFIKANNTTPFEYRKNFKEKSL